MTVEAGRERLAASTSYGSAVKNCNGQFTAKTSPPERSDRSAKRQHALDRSSLRLATNCYEPLEAELLRVGVSASLGFEPRQRDSESLVLPLHYEATSEQNKDRCASLQVAQLPSRRIYAAAIFFASSRISVPC